MPFKNVELIKWVALILMIGDHINKYLLNDTIPILYNAGRVVMPLFALFWRIILQGQIHTPIAYIQKSVSD